MPWGEIYCFQRIYVASRLLPSAKKYAILDRILVPSVLFSALWIMAIAEMNHPKSKYANAMFSMLVLLSAVGA